MTRPWEFTQRFKADNTIIWCDVLECGTKHFIYQQFRIQEPYSLHDLKRTIQRELNEIFDQIEKGFSKQKYYNKF